MNHQSNKEELLKLLETHGQQFLQSFNGLGTGIVRKQKGANGEELSRPLKRPRVDEEWEEEWSGISDKSTHEWTNDGSDGGTDTDSKDDIDEDDEFTYESHSHQPRPNVVVFSEASTSSLIPKAKKSGFMSSKVAKLSQETQKTHGDASSDNEDDDLTNSQNDALLHRLVHTKLLSGSLDPDLDLTPAQRKKALAGRIMEVAGKAKLGRGEVAVRQAEHNRAAKHIREGLSEKRTERQKKELEEAKHLGNYHPTLKSLYDASSTSKGHRKRERGIKMGVGSFKGGILRLSKSEISGVEGTSSFRGKGGRRRGGKR